MEMVTLCWIFLCGLNIGSVAKRERSGLFSMSYKKLHGEIRHELDMQIWDLPVCFRCLARRTWDGTLKLFLHSGLVLQMFQVIIWSHFWGHGHILRGRGWRVQPNPFAVLCNDRQKRKKVREICVSNHLCIHTTSRTLDEIAVKVAEKTRMYSKRMHQWPIGPHCTYVCMHPCFIFVLRLIPLEQTPIKSKCPLAFVRCLVFAP